MALRWIRTIGYGGELWSRNGGESGRLFGTRQGPKRPEIAATDVGAFAAAAFADPDRFNGHSIDLAAEALTMVEVAAKLAAGTGKSVTAVPCRRLMR